LHVVGVRRLSPVIDDLIAARRAALRLAGNRVRQRCWNAEIADPSQNTRFNL